MITEVSTLADLELFTKQLIDEGTNAHPDEDFHNYVNIETNEGFYTSAESAVRNSLMAQCSDICNAAGEDIYEIMHDVYLQVTGLSEFIPTSSHIANQSE